MVGIIVATAAFYAAKDLLLLPLVIAVLMAVIFNSLAIGLEKGTLSSNDCRDCPVVTCEGEYK